MAASGADIVLESSLVVRLSCTLFRSWILMVPRGWSAFRVAGKGAGAGSGRGGGGGPAVVIELPVLSSPWYWQTIVINEDFNQHSTSVLLQYMTYFNRFTKEMILCNFILDLIGICFKSNNTVCFTFSHTRVCYNFNKMHSYSKYLLIYPTITFLMHVCCTVGVSHITKLILWYKSFILRK